MSGFFHIKNSLAKLIHHIQLKPITRFGILIMKTDCCLKKWKSGVNAKKSPSMVLTKCDDVFVVAIIILILIIIVSIIFLYKTNQ